MRFASLIFFSLLPVSAWAGFDELQVTPRPSDILVRVTSDMPIDQPGGIAGQANSGIQVPLPLGEKVQLPDALLERQLVDRRKASVAEAWARPARVGTTSAVYFVLRGGTKDDRLLSVATPWAEKAELHDSVTDENQVISMKVLDGLVVSANSQLSFSAGGRHIMLIGIRRELRRGTMFPITLNFRRAGTIKALVEVRGPKPTDIDDAEDSAEETEGAVSISDPQDKSAFSEKSTHELHGH